MNNKEFKKHNPFENDMKIQNTSSTEFAKEFISPLDGLKISLDITNGDDVETLESRKQKKKNK